MGGGLGSPWLARHTLAPEAAARSEGRRTSWCRPDLAGSRPLSAGRGSLKLTKRTSPWAGGSGCVAHAWR
jgi:hypothetical protein